MTSGCPLTDNKKSLICLDNTHVSRRIGGVGHSRTRVQRDSLAAESSRLLLRCNVDFDHTVLAWLKTEGAKAVIALPDKSLKLHLEEVAVNVADALRSQEYPQLVSRSYGVPRFGVPVMRPEYPTCSEATRGRPEQTGGTSCFRGEPQPLITLKNQVHFAIRKLWDEYILLGFSM